MLTHHLRAVRHWARRHSGSASIDLETFQLDLRANDRLHTLYPQFRARNDGALFNTSTFLDTTTGFIGWLPYRPIRWDLSMDKRKFKRFAAGKGLSTPAWPDPAAVPSFDYIVKPFKGSFGVSITGPWRHDDSRPAPAVPADAFVEQFIPGINIKLWIWGRTVFHAHCARYASVTGDGIRSIETLRRELASQQNPRMPRGEHDEVDRLAALAYQGYVPEHVLAPGETAWLDFRFGREYVSPAATESADNKLGLLSREVLESAQRVADHLVDDIKANFGAPILYSLDGVVDADGKAWWLEVNSNPSLPPTGYPHVFSTLFGASPSS